MGELNWAEALHEVERTTEARRTADADAARLASEQQEAIRAALHARVTVGELVRITGLTRARIYQIRDGR